MKTSISRQSYRRIPQAALSVFARNVAQRLKENPAYSTLSKEADLLDTTQQAFAVALVNAADGGRDARILKNQLLQSLQTQLDEISLLVDRLAQGNPALVVQAGFDLRVVNTGARSVSVLAPPVAMRVASNGRIGEVQVQLSDAQPELVRQHSIEYSTDGGQTFQNGHYDSRMRFTLRDLPREKNLMLRFRALGRGDVKSAWSEPVAVAVL
jgi:hypothetical protein